MDRRRVLRLAALSLLALSALRVDAARGRQQELPPVWIPEDVEDGEHWVAVNLTRQAAIAMSGVDAVHLAQVTTGMDGWETPEGQFRIVRRVYNETMTSAALGIPPGPDSYVLTDVLFTQYFTHVGHALHLNYWRPAAVFGNQRTSHGCVGMRYNDAAFSWTFLGLGSRVVVHS